METVLTDPSQTIVGVPSDWTIRFKHGRSTILLLVDPLTSLATIKESLLTTLAERFPAGIPPTPTNATTVSHPSSSADVILASPKNELDLSKGWNEIEDASKSPQELGWKDGCLVAFSYTGLKWDVQVPSYEEAYGDQMDADAEEAALTAAENELIDMDAADVEPIDLDAALRF